jgi:hypothetical protein
MAGAAVDSADATTMAEATIADAGTGLARDVEGDSTPYPVTIATARSSAV